MNPSITNLRKALHEQCCDEGDEIPLTPELVAKKISGSLYAATERMKLVPVPTAADLQDLTEDQLRVYTWLADHVLYSVTEVTEPGLLSNDIHLSR